MQRRYDALRRGVERWWARGTFGLIAVALALLACYGLLALTALLPLIGARLVLDQGAWAGAIVVLAGLTVLAVLPGAWRHRSVLPAIGALIGGGLIGYALLVDYHGLLELAGFVVLVGAVLQDTLLRRRPGQRRPDAAAGPSAG